MLEKEFDSQFNIAPVPVRLEGPHALEEPDLNNLGEYIWPTSTVMAGKIVAELRSQGFPCGSITGIIPLFGHADQNAVNLKGWSVICSAGTAFYYLQKNREHRLVIFDETHKTSAQTEAEETAESDAD